ncbi:MAG: hypothetical protein SYC29_13915 [Planctomycetota bacterium]|nr:hypothetical protein [Planctomycetota bacterium]
MAEGVGWKTAELQIETLVPGVLLVLAANAASGNYFSTMVGRLVPADGFIRGVLFVAAAYAAGVLGAIACRAVLDLLSERGVRAWVFSRYAHADPRKLLRDRRTADTRFRTDYWHERKVRSRRKDVAFWNAAYRSALRTTSRSVEVERRRSQGQVLRNLALPFGIWAFVAFPNTLGWQTVGAVSALILFVAFVVPYAYAEYVNFAEAYDLSN